MKLEKIMVNLLVSGLLAGTAVNAKTCDKKYYTPDWDHQAPTVDAFNYVRAESDIQFRDYAERFKAFGKFVHGREHYSVEEQITHSGNRDTLYSFGVFDLSQSPLTVSLPETDGRYMSLMLISEDHDIYPAYYAPGKWIFTEKEIGTRYIMLGIRTFANPNDPEDMKKAHSLQDKVKVVQSDTGDLSGIPKWNRDEMMVLRKAFNTIGSTTSDSSSYFGVKCDRSYLMNAMGVAVGWGGLQPKDALYIPANVVKNDGKTPYILTVPRDVPVDGFWSVTVYDKDRFMVKNRFDRYSLNNVTARKNKDGSVTIRFGGDPEAENFIPIMDGWVYIVRLYRPHKDLLDGTWKFPEAVEAEQ